MQVRTRKNKVVALLSFLGLGIFGLSKAASFSLLEYTNNMIKNITEKFTAISKERPEDRVYLHFDKPFYKPGETIWFKAYVRNGNDLKASTQSDIVYIELINPKGSIEKQISLISKGGGASGDFLLEESLPGGLYKVKAYTNWQKNEDSFFEKDIQVQAVVLPRLKMKIDFERKAYGAGDEVVATLDLQTLENQNLANYAYSFTASIEGNKILEGTGITDAEGKAKVKCKLPKQLNSNDGLLNVMIAYEGSTEAISRAIPIVLNNIALTFYPEGGDMVSGFDNVLAFKALNEFGKPADVEGSIFDSKNHEVASFKSFHQGMGKVGFKPLKGEKYTAKITKPERIATQYTLPEALERGFVLHVGLQNETSLPLSISSSETEELSILVQIRGEVVYSKSFNAQQGLNQQQIPVEDFPMGVAQITLFDKKGIARAERLAFVNKDKQLKISIETEKEKYLPREKVNMTVKVTDERGMPMPSQLSLSVVDDKLLSFADDKQAHIFSSLLLQYDIKDKIEEPNFYFDPKEAKAEQALDQLLLTSGWRRFTWEQVLDKSLPVPQYVAEKALVSGVVFDAYKATKLAGATVSVQNTTLKTTTDKEGRFTLAGVDLSELATLEIKADGYYNGSQVVAAYSSHQDVYLYNQKGGYGVDEEEGIGGAIPAPAGALRVKAVDGAIEKPVAHKQPAVFFKAENKIEVLAPVLAVAVPKPVAQKEIAAFDMKKRKRDVFFDEIMEERAFAPQVPKYYRARVFATPDYAHDALPEVRTDFRSTIYWNGDVQTDRTGKTVISFYNSDEITSFRAVVEGIASDGAVGRAEKTYFTQLPFSMQVKVPVSLTSGDLVSLPLVLKNNTKAPLTGKLNLDIPKGLQLLSSLPSSISIEALQTKTIHLDFKTGSVIGLDTISFAFAGMGLNDAFSQEINIAPRGFPLAVSLSGQAQEKTFEFEVKNLVQGSLKAEFVAYPSVVSDLMKGIESILREPYGCFEQTSTSNYPNVMVQQYLQEMDEQPSEKVEALLDKGYKRLVTYETKEKGYEWFGGAPAHEGLTAYGLMQFSDMKKVYGQVDDAMVQRTSTWLLGRRDGKGSFKRSSQALDEFGRASEEVTNAYIVYGLSEAGNREIQKELDLAYDKAMANKDPYQLALVANALYNFKDATRAAKVMEVLYKLQDKKGSWTGTTHSITHSQGNSLVIETTSLVILALIKSGKPEPSALSNAVSFLVNSRSGSGGFGSTQGTVLALKALTHYARYARKTDESGHIEIYIDGKKVAERHYEAGEREAIVLSGFEKHFSEGKHSVKVLYNGVKNPLPYAMSVNWSTVLPNNDADCKVSLHTKLSDKMAYVGETVRLSTVLANTTKEGLPMTMAIVGIPAGLSAQPWQLKELMEKKKVDFYEIRGNSVFFYYRQMLPSESKEINLDLKAEIAGEYEAQASSGYLYYTNEYKVWSSPERIVLKKR